MTVDFEQLIRLVREAGGMMLRAHEAREEDEITVKPGTANFVTVHDVRIQEFLLRSIKELLPEARFIAEEKENDAAVLEAEACFIIDPIDGTTNFIHDCRHSCVSLALVSRGEPLFGVIYNPYLDELYHAHRGGGAYLNGTPLCVSDRPAELALVAYGTAPYYKERFGEKTFRLCRDLFMVGADVRRCGSAALDLANLAAGRYDAFFEFLLSPWDIAAGYLLITEAGGVITDMRGAPITFSAPCPVLAANPTVYPTLLSLAERYAE